jgi:type IV pilus assembly protein PilE
MRKKFDMLVSISQHKKHSGFTLIELMITVAIIAILAAVALPSYRQYVIRGNRTAAEAEMMNIANMEQQYLLANRSYTNSLSALSYSAPGSVSTNYTFTDTGNVSLASYLDASCTVAADAGGAPSFVITLSPRGSQSSDGSISLSSTGIKCPAGKW